MAFIPKLSPEQWAEAGRMRAEGATYAQIGRHFGVSPSAVGQYAQRHEWPSPAGEPAPKPARARPRPAAPGIRTRLAERLYRVIEYRIKLMELRMIKQLQAHLQPGGDAPDGIMPPPALTKDERDSFAALIDSINKVTEIASEPAPAADGRRRAATASRAVSPELTALSDDIDPDGLAAASEKDALRREIAERLAKIFPPS